MNHLQSASHGQLPYTEDDPMAFALSVEDVPTWDTVGLVAFPGPQQPTEPILMHNYQPPHREVSDGHIIPNFTSLDYTPSQIHQHSPPSIFYLDYAIDQLITNPPAPSADSYPSLSTSVNTFEVESQMEAEIHSSYFAMSEFDYLATGTQPLVPQNISPSRPRSGLSGNVFSWPIPAHLQDAVIELANSKEFRCNMVIPNHLRRPFLKKVRHALEVRMQSGGRGSRNGDFAYKCLWHECERIMARRDHALDHVAQHLGSKPHKCPHCHLRFLRLADCKRHARSTEHDNAKKKDGSVSSEGSEVWEQCHTMGEFSVPLTWDIFARLVRVVARFLRGRSR